MKNWNSYTPVNFHAVNVVWAGMGSNSATKVPTAPFHPRQFMRDARPCVLERDHATRIAMRAGRLAGLARLSPSRQGTV